MAFQRSGYRINERHSIAFQRTDSLHIRCLDEEGNALAGRDFVLTLADGEVIRGQLDAEGWTKQDGVRPGECDFRLVEGEVEPTPVERETHWINVVIKDEEGRPLVGQSYVLGISDGTLRKGKLDAEGRCLVERVPAGPCFFALKAREVSGQGEVHFVRLQFTDEDGDPMAGLPFELVVGDLTFAGTTSPDGRVIADVPITHDEGELRIWTDEAQSEEPYVWPIKISEVAAPSAEA